MAEKIDRTPELTAAIIQTLTDFYVTDDGTSAIDAVTARGALVVALAVLIEIDPTVVTKRDISHFVGIMSRALKARIVEIRLAYDKSGYRPWPADVQHVN